MNRAILVALGTGAVITSAAAIGIGARSTPAAEPMTRAQYRSALEHIEAARARALESCADLRTPERESCHAKAQAAAIVSAAELEQRFRRTPESARAAQRARIEARYRVARARCTALKGFANDQCLISVHAALGRALLESQDPYTVGRS